MPNLNVGLGAASALTICQELDTCLQFASTLRPCCCPTGNTGIKVSCPNGYVLNSAANTCSRDQSTSSDATGTFVVIYETCAAQQETYACYKGSTQTMNCACSVVGPGLGVFYRATSPRSFS